MKNSARAHLNFFRPTRQFFTFLLSSATVAGYAQAINIDLDIFGGPPENGNGAPSDAFGAAANQPGRWNRINAVEPGPYTLISLSGATTSVVVSAHAAFPGYFAGSQYFPANSGDYALLLNDAAEVGTVGNGGHLTYSFGGFIAGIYDLYTYAANIAGRETPVPIHVPEAIANQTQVVTGPMAGNSFGYLTTHSIHRVSLGPNGGFSVIIDRPIGMPYNWCVNGFQIVPVPEPNSWLVFVAGLSYAVSRACKYPLSVFHGGCDRL